MTTRRTSPRLAIMRPSASRSAWRLNARLPPSSASTTLTVLIRAEVCTGSMKARHDGIAVAVLGAQDDDAALWRHTLATWERGAHADPGGKIDR